MHVAFFDAIVAPTPWAIVAALASWVAAVYMYRDKKKEKVADQTYSLEIHRDELTFQLLQNARQEMSSARVEVEDLRDEVKKLRSMENHFFHFQQSLDHLEALLFSPTDEEKVAAERNARAFLTRMRRLNEAKGTLANEAQRAASEISVLDANTKKGPGNGG